MKQFIDITRPVDENLFSWPGRLPPEHIWEKSLSRGDHANVSTWKMNAHSGTHMDAPNHFIEDGLAIDQIQPEIFIGECLVLDLQAKDCRVLDEALAKEHQGEKRLLIKTQHSEAVSDSSYPPHEALLTPEAARILAKTGLLLLGTDRLSVDDSRGDDYTLHHTLLGAGCVIIEALSLKAAAAGRYGLIAAPLRLAGKEASPVRAFLRADSSTIKTLPPPAVRRSQ